MVVVEQFQEKMAKLERELEEMTAALSQAWDQLVPFLEAPAPQSQTTDFLPVLHAVMAAADSDCSAIFLFEQNEWLSMPTDLVLSQVITQHLREQCHDKAITIHDIEGAVIWAFAPVMLENTTIGALGIGTYHIERSFTVADVRIVTRMAERAGSQIANAQLALSREREAAAKREMDIASQIQQSLQPKKPPRVEGVQIASYWQPAKQVGGDAWGWVLQDNQRLTWFIVDVAGKGLPAALAAVSLHTAIRLALRMQLTPAEVLSAINGEFYDAYTLTDLMATVVILSLHVESGVIEIANAGHPPTLIHHAGTWLRLPASVPPIGVMPVLSPDTDTLLLATNDLIVCYSDGFTEIETKNSGLWGETGLINSVPPDEKQVDIITKHIVAAAQRAGSISDDQTLVTALFTGR